MYIFSSLIYMFLTGTGYRRRWGGCATPRGTSRSPRHPAWHPHGSGCHWDLEPSGESWHPLKKAVHLIFSYNINRQNINSILVNNLEIFLYNICCKNSVLISYCEALYKNGKELLDTQYDVFVFKYYIIPTYPSSS